MRNWITLFEGKEWWDYPHTSLDDMQKLKPLFVRNSGTDPDWQEIIEQLGLSGNEEEEEILGTWFDDLLAKFRNFGSSFPLYRRISVDDIESFISSVRNVPLGIFWADNRESASDEYHPEKNKDHSILLIAEAPLSSVDWGSSFTAQTGHPHECEITLCGPVRDLRVYTINGLVFEDRGPFETG